MKSSSIVFKKIVFLCCLWGSFLSAHKVCAQIIYTDIADATPSATYPLDLNNDNNVDFLIQFDAAAKIVCKPQNNNVYAGNIVSAMHLPWALKAASSICDTLANWYGANNPGTMAWNTSIGYWVGASNKFLALKIMVGNNAYYGWARFDVLPSSGSFTIKDYAYNSTPNACIQSGQTSLGIPENTKPHIAIFPNPFSSTTRIQCSSPFQNASLRLYNSYGQLVLQENNISGSTITLSREQVPSGCYYIQVSDEYNNQFTEPLIITGAN